jgi:hypothetical protein
MRKPIFFLIMAFLALAVAVPNSRAKVYQTIKQTYQTASTPLDVTTSEDGLHTFVLTKGKVLIYGKTSLEDEINVDPNFDRISAAINGDKIFLISSQGKKVQEVLLDFVKHIDVSGNPFLGPEDAKVTIVAFSDFQ